MQIPFHSISVLSLLLLVYSVQLLYMSMYSKVIYLYSLQIGIHMNKASFELSQVCVQLCVLQT